MKWISVKERLPEKISHYLVTDGVNVTEASWLQRTSMDSFWFRFTSLNNITHWMPLPEPPSNEL